MSGGSDKLISIKETIASGAGWLESRGVPEARLNVEHMLAHVLGCRRLDLYLQFDRPLMENELEPLRLMMRRRAAREPLQHILGTVEFAGRTFHCDARALVPRPETEELATRVVAMLPEGFGGRVLDMGCGSGVLGLTVAAAFPACRLVLADVSQEALALAQENALALESAEDSESESASGKFDFVRADLFDSLDGRFDVVLANLPYIPTDEIAGLEEEVRRDPVTALDGGADGLDIIRRFAQGLPSALEEGGFAALEVGEGQAEAVAALLEAAGCGGAHVERDASGRGRFVITAPLGGPSSTAGG